MNQLNTYIVLRIHIQKAYVHRPSRVIIVVWDVMDYGLYLARGSHDTRYVETQ